VRLDFRSLEDIDDHSVLAAAPNSCVLCSGPVLLVFLIDLEESQYGLNMLHPLTSI